MVYVQQIFIPLRIFNKTIPSQTKNFFDPNQFSGQPVNSFKKGTVSQFWFPHYKRGNIPPHLELL